MKKGIIRTIVTVLAILVAIFAASLLLTGCRAYDKPELVKIEASQTAFLIPLVGDTNQQAAFKSEEELAKMEVATKEVTIPHRWVQTGYGANTGEWHPSATLIVVERKPETREWTELQGTGTSNTNQGIEAESKESIGFMAEMNCSAQIDENDAVRFLYRYNTKPLADVMDTQIRAMIESTFVEECAKYNLEDLLVHKADIMKVVRDTVIPYFKDNGINITVIGLKGEFQYLNPDIQKSIDAKFQSAQAIISQQNENDRVVSKAEADAKAKVTLAQADADALLIAAKAQADANKALAASITPEYIQYQYLLRWNGVLPTVMTGSSGTIFNMPLPTKD